MLVALVVVEGLGMICGRYGEPESGLPKVSRAIVSEFASRLPRVAFNFPLQSYGSGSLYKPPWIPYIRSAKSKATHGKRDANFESTSEILKVCYSLALKEED